MRADNAGVTLRLFGPLRTAVGQSQVRLPPAAPTVREALVQFVARYGDAARSFLFDENGKQRPGLIVLLNGEVLADGRDACLKDGDEIDLLLPLAGG